jgi:hypothetical protein
MSVIIADNIQSPKKIKIQKSEDLYLLYMAEKPTLRSVNYSLWRREKKEEKKRRRGKKEKEKKGEDISQKIRA